MLLSPLLLSPPGHALCNLCRGLLDMLCSELGAMGGTVFFRSDSLSLVGWEGEHYDQGGVDMFVFYVFLFGLRLGKKLCA